MPENPEEKEKCLEKLSQMEKYLSFLDFMIDRIKKKNNAASLESQLSKFTHMRTMITERDCKHGWDGILRVEGVIKKLISNLDYKGVTLDDTEPGSSSGKKMEGLLKTSYNPMEHSGTSNVRKDVPGYNPRNEQGGSKSNSSSASSTMENFSISTTASYLPPTTTNSLPSMGQAPSTVDFIMNKLKMSAQQKMASESSKSPLSALLGAIAKPIEKKPEKKIEADLNKDLDGFDLTDESETSTNQSSSFGKSPQPSSIDLLASSRQKLLKSVQKQKTDEQNKPWTENISEFNKSKNVSDVNNFSDSRRSINFDNFEPVGSVMTSPVQTHTAHAPRNFEPIRSVSSSSNIQHHRDAEPIRTIISGSTVHTPLKIPEKKKSAEPVFSEKSPPFDPSNKQKLREKLSAEISEVHKVGKQVGGSLRGLKDPKKNAAGHEEEELFKPDKVTQIRSSSPEKQKKNTEDKSSKKFGEKNEEKRNEAQKSVEKNKDKKLSYQDYLKKTDKIEGKSSKKNELSHEIDSMNNEELLKFMKENMSTLPNLSTMEPNALRKLVKAFLESNTSANSPDIDDLSDISDQEFGDFSKKSDKNKKVDNVHPLASVIMSKVGKDGVAKVDINKKNDDLELETIGDKTCSDMEMSPDERGNDDDDDNYDDQEYAERLLENVNINKPPKLVDKRPSLLDLPFPPRTNEATKEGVPPIPFLGESNRTEIRKENDKSDPRWRPPPPLISTQFPNNHYGSPYQSEMRPEDLVRPNTFEQQPRPNTFEQQPRPNTFEQQPRPNTFDHQPRPNVFDQQPRRPPLLATPAIPPLFTNLVYPPNEVPAPDYRQPQNPSYVDRFQNVDLRHQNQPSDIRYRNININMPSDILSTGNTYNIAVVRPNTRPPNMRPPNQEEPNSYAEHKQRKKEMEGHNQRNVINVHIHNSPQTEFEKVPEIVKDKVPEVSNEGFTAKGDSKQKSSNVPVKNVEEKRKSIDGNRDPRQRRWEDTKSRERSDSRERRDSRDSYRSRNYERWDERKSSSDRRKDSSDTEDLVSPLEKLYAGDDKPKTGRGYGFQKYKIPKKNREPLASPKESSKDADIDKDKDKSLPRSKVIRDEMSSSPMRDDSPVDRNAQKETPKRDHSKKEVPKKDADKKKSDKSEKHKKTDEKTKKPSEQPHNIKSNTNAKDRRRRVIIESSDSESEKVDEKNSETRRKKKEEKAKIPEVEDSCDRISQMSCDSQTMTEPEDITPHEEPIPEVAPVSEKTPEKPKPVQVQCAGTSTENKESKVDTKPNQSAEEIALLENIIQKSIESGESKMLLAKAKLFEMMLSNTKKLSSKKLKKIQKLIKLVSVSGSESSTESSSSTSSSSDESEKKKKKKKEEKKEEKSSEKKEKVKEKKEEKKKEGKEDKKKKKGQKELKSKAYISDSASSSEDSDTEVEKEDKEKGKEEAKKEEVEKKKKSRVKRKIISESSASDDSDVEEIEKEVKEKDKDKDKPNVKEEVEEKRKKTIKSKEYISDTTSSDDSDVEEVEAEKEKPVVKEEPKVKLEVKVEQSEKPEETPTVEPEIPSDDNPTSQNDQITPEESKVDEPAEDPAAESQPPKKKPVKKKAGLKGKSKKRRQIRSEEFKIRYRKMKSRETRQKRLLKESQENSQDSTDSKVTEKKVKGKGKGKTELDRLHEDIRSMFISEGVITATGRRMCTLWKESGGNVKKLDMTKEFEEEKRRATRQSKKAQDDDDASSRSQSADTFASSQSRSRNHSPEDATKNDERELEKKLVKNLPNVVLSRIDIEKYGFAYKISDDPISLRRMRGRNLARRGRSGVRLSRVPIKKERIKSPAEIKKEMEISREPEIDCSCYLKRNLRKVMKLRNSSKKKVYIKKKLVDTIDRLKKIPQQEQRMLSPERTNEKTRGPRKKKAMSNKSESDKAVPVFGNFTQQLKKKLIDYSFDKKRTTYDCLICLNSSSSITSHYKSCHPETEVLISRLNKEEAEKAIADSKENNYDVRALEKGASLEAVKRRVKSKLSERSYVCRMCTHAKINDPNLFFGHVSVHTGEYRYSCPAETCAMTAPSLENIKFHILSKHSKTKDSLYEHVIELFPMPTEYGNLYGYLCSKCHFVQIMRRNVEYHVATFHTSDIDVEIIKIDMSSKPSKNQTAKEPPKKVVRTSKSKGVKRANEDGEGSKRSTRSRPVEDKEPVVAEEGAEKGKTGKKKRKSEVDLLLEMQKKDMGMGDSDSSSEDTIDATEDNTPNVETDSESKSSDAAVFTEKLNEFVKTVQLKNLQVHLRRSDEKKDDQDKVEEDEDDDGSIFQSSEKNEDLLEEGFSLKERKEEVVTPEEKNVKVLVGIIGTDQLVREVKVGPLESKMQVNMEILYECFVKGCIFSSCKYEQFEKHIDFAHNRTKWDGECQTCGSKVEVQDGQSIGGSYKLSAALLHLRSHEVYKDDLPEKEDKKPSKESLSNQNIEQKDVPEIEDNNGKIEIEDVQKIVKTEPESTGIFDTVSISIDENDDSSNISIKSEEPIKNEEETSPFPVKPLLRVRTFLGDRLSKPKIEPVVSITEIPPEPSLFENPPEQEQSESYPFTIENVRTLSPESTNEPIVDINTVPQPQPGSPSTIRIENVGTITNMKDFPPNASVLSGKPILVRSTPSPKIALRPGNPVIPISIAPKQIHQFKVIPSSSNSPVIFTQLPNSNNIRIIASSNITIPQLMVSQTPPFTATAKIVPIPTPTIAINQPKISTETQTATSNILEENPLLTQTVLGNKPSFETLRCSPPNNPTGKLKKLPIILKSPTKVVQSVVVAPTPSTSNSPILPKPESSQDEINTFRRPQNTALGGKNVKDAKIYQEMLSKSKLCHLFKCMAVECSYTCNSESVFTRHIGLHEAEASQRMKHVNKNLKAKKVYNWQQCAYCCEVIVQSGAALSQHILLEHGHCLYQCAYCFYRAVSQIYVTLHQNSVHAQILEEQPRLILKCKPIPNLPVSKTATDKQTRRQSVRPYHCVQCGGKFYITQEFMDHLAKEHQSVTAYTCHICKNLCFKADRLITHYKMHSYSMFQCAYCLHGTETEKEMLLHLCNCHFSQPAYMYLRALAKGQKGNHLDALEVVTYEDDAPNLDHIVEAEADESDGSDSGQRPGLSMDLTAIVSELGISVPEESSQPHLNPVLRDLMTIDNKNPKTTTVESLLPNAQFSSESDNILSPGKDDGISVPLGQLPLEALGMQKIETTGTPTTPTTPKEVTEADKTLKLNEILINLSQRDKSITVSPVKEDTAPKMPVATHKMPPTVSNSRIAAKNVYPAKTAAKKQGGISQEGEIKKTLPILYQRLSTGEKNDEEQVISTGKNIMSGGGVVIHDKLTGKATTLPIVNKVFSMAQKDSNAQENIPVISEVKSLSSDGATETLNQIVINIQSKVDNETPQLQPPIIRVEDFPINADGDKSSIEKVGNESAEKKTVNRPESPEIIILDDDDEPENVTPADKAGNPSRKRSIDDEEMKKVKKLKSDDAIMKEMERLRNQMNETDCLLDDDTSQKSDTSTVLKLNVNEKISEDEGKILSPIEEAIYSLNKKLESETANKTDGDKTCDDNDKEELITLCDDKECSVDSVKNPDKDDDASLDSFKDKNESERVKKNDGKVTGEKNIVELSGKDLYRCGNKSCCYEADNDVELKEHLYVCDFSRESNLLACPHCDKKIQKTFYFIEHLKLHGAKKYSCGICQFASALEKSVITHLKTKHKSTAVKTMPRDSESKGYFVLYPKNHKTEPKTNFETIGYSPGDEDKLPLQSVYQFNVKCAKCPYYTKVRSNMVRHLKIHVKSAETEGVVVPSTAPTNPVPCLDTKEKMFDKMTNLAASSQLAQAMKKEAVSSLTPEEEARLPQFVPEQMRFKCCAFDCNYITVDDNMLRNHIKTLHEEITFYSCPHCQETVPVDFRNTPFEKIGNHLKYHDTKLYKCVHCSYFHHHKHIVEKHCLEKHPEKKFYVYMVREPKIDFMSEEEAAALPSDKTPQAWKCNFCGEFESTTRNVVQEHVLKVHNSKSKYKCKLCDMKSSQVGSFTSHYASKHPGEKVAYIKSIVKVNASANCDGNSSSQSLDSSKEHFDTTPLWKRDAPRVRHIRGILIEEEEVKTKKSKKTVEDDDDSTASSSAPSDTFFCPLCPDKKNAFQTKNSDNFRSHLYQELNYQQFACILCGKMFVDKREFDKHHDKIHQGKPQAMKQTKEDGEIKFWVEKVIAKQREEIGEKKRRNSTEEKQTPKKKPKPTPKSPDNSRSVLKKNLIKSPSGNRLTRSSSSSDNENFKIEYEKDFTCRHCQIKVSDLVSLKAHIKVTHLKLGRFRCTYCFTTFQTEALAWKHCKNEHPFDEAKPEINPEAAKLKEDFWKTEYGFQNDKILKNFVPKSIIRCRFCNFRDIPQLVESHEIQHLEATQFKCGHCDFKTGGRDQITNHIQISHPGAKTLFSECPIIPNVVSNKNTKETDSKNVNIVNCCRYCAFESNLEKVLVTHLESEHKTTELCEIRKETNGKIYFCCGVCTFRAGDVDTITKHGGEFHGQSAMGYKKIKLIEFDFQDDIEQCVTCLKINCICGSDDGEVEDGSYNCPHCDYLTKSYDDCVSHFKKHFPKLCCRTCQEKFVDNVDFDKHTKETKHTPIPRRLEANKDLMEEFKATILYKQDGKWTSLGKKRGRSDGSDAEASDSKKVKGKSFDNEV